MCQARPLFATALVICRRLGRRSVPLTPQAGQMPGQGPGRGRRGGLLDGTFLDFLDPWGNRVEVVEYADVQFSKAPGVLVGMGLAPGKTEEARRQLVEKCMAPGMDG